MTEYLGSRLETFKLSNILVDGLAGWETLLGRLEGSEKSEETTESIFSSFLLVTAEFLVCSFEVLDTEIKSDGSFVFTIDALEESPSVELTTELVESTSHDGGHLLLVSFSLLGLFGSNEDLSSGFTNVETEVLPVARFGITDGSVDFMVDINAIDEEIFSNVPSESSWAGEGFSH